MVQAQEIENMLQTLFKVEVTYKGPPVFETNLKYRAAIIINEIPLLLQEMLSNLGLDATECCIYASPQTFSCIHLKTDAAVSAFIQALSKTHVDFMNNYLSGENIALPLECQSDLREKIKSGEVSASLDMTASAPTLTIKRKGYFGSPIHSTYYLTTPSSPPVPDKQPVPGLSY